MSVGHPAIPPGYATHVDDMVAMSRQVEGHLTEREVRFLSLLGAVPTARGEVLEIGSYKGKSTTILAKSVLFAGGSRVCAVDPLDLPAETDPTEIAPGALAGVFYGNLRDRGVEHAVEFHPRRSEELARGWNRKLRVLWIDGDHTWAGTRSDVEAFAGHLAPGGIIAFHDVLHHYAGPVRAMAELVLPKGEYGACGVCGSIGWAQFLGDRALAAPFDQARETLRARLAAMVPQASRGAARNAVDKFTYKVRRARVPHHDVVPEQWAARVLKID